jgi:Zn-dependent metalloprotease
MMGIHKCNCHYVPSHVLENLAKNAEGDGRAGAYASVQQSALIRKQRASRESSIEGLLSGVSPATFSAAPAPPVSREVYDSNQTWVQRVPPVARGEGDPATGDEDEDNAFDYAGVVRDYFQGELSRNSIDNLGMTLILNVHFGVNYMNAFWDGDEMTFGDGDGAIFVSFAKSLDVVAHELAHGVTQFTAALDYYSQSGAMNESFSDVFGAAITQYHLGQDAGSADWLVGNEIMGPTLFGESLRSMKMPGTAYDNALMGTDPQPSHMNNYYAGPADNQGVHINSGIFNRAFYLVASDNIGTQKAAQVWYHALQNLWSTADFNDGVEVIVRSAQVLTKSGAVPQGTAQTVRAAFKEVGL